MKKLILVIVLFSIQINFAQNKFPVTGSVYFDTNLKIGKQEAPSSTAGEIIRLSLQPYGHTGGPWNFKTRDNYSLAFLDIDYGVVGTILTISTNKNIGIGTTQPSAILDINTPLVAQGKYNSQKWSTSNPEYNLTLQTSWNNGGINQEFIQRYNGVNYSSLAFYNGRIGIGTSNPISKLSVLGSLTIDSGLTNASTRPLISPGTLLNAEIRGYNATNPLADDGFLRLSAGGGTNNVKSYIDLSGYSTQPDMYANIVMGTGGRERMRINSNGNVGIGTTNPDSKLTVAGNIHAQEVKVTVNAGTVPDYVFANDYKLKSLQEVEEFIKQNSHLPEIPSAKEIEKNGLMLAEMNMSLLKKIEELTLYSIEQNKEIQKQNNKILILEQRVKKIESKSKQN